MSWSINAVGVPKAVAAKVRKDLEAIRCAEPEQAIKASVIDAVEAACNALPDGTAVKVEASGSQYAQGGGFINSLSVKVEPIHGFVG